MGQLAVARDCAKTLAVTDRLTAKFNQWRRVTASERSAVLELGGNFIRKCYPCKQRLESIKNEY